jgi:hypothetical protein
MNLEIALIGFYLQSIVQGLKPSADIALRCMQWVSFSSEFLI